MGSPCALTLFADTRIEAGTIAAASIAEVERIEQAYSRYRPDSIVSAINAAAREGGEIDADPETASLIDHAFENLINYRMGFSISPRVSCAEFGTTPLALSQTKGRLQPLSNALG